MTPTVAAGIDAGKAFLDIGFAPAGKAFRMPNVPASFPALIERLRRQGVVRVALEAIGPYARDLVRALTEAAFQVAVVNPRRIKAFRDAEGGRAKTDRLDAGLIARFALLMTDALRPVPTADQIDLKDLATRRRQLTEMIAIEKTRLKQARHPRVADSIRLAIEALAAECRLIEAELDARLDADPTLARKRDILLSIPGVGPRTATLLLTDLPELGTTDRKAIASLAGHAPHPNQSGLAPGRHAIAGGRPCVRSGLYMAALVACRAKSSPYRNTYLAMREAGKPAKVAIIAVARLIVTTANALIKQDRTFEHRPLA